MYVNQLNKSPKEILLKITNHLEFKDLAALEQTSKEIQTLLCEKECWKMLSEEYGLIQTDKFTKEYLRDHTISNPEKLGYRIQKFFCDTLHSTNVFFKCFFKDTGTLEIERIQDTKEKKSLTISYIRPVDENTKIAINQKIDDMLTLQELLFEESFKKNLIW